MNYTGEPMVAVTAIQSFHLVQPAQPGLSPMIADHDGPWIVAGEVLSVPASFAAILKSQNKVK